MKIIFMGTPDFAVPCLERLIADGNELAAVYTQPDKPVGRKHILTPPPVKECALRHNITVLQPQTLKTERELERLKSFNADLIVVVAYGKILPQAMLDSARCGAINVHASLLPKYRGAAPIQRSILDGETETGVTVQQMDAGVDTGDILYTVKTQIDINETAAALFDRLAVIGADALQAVVNDIDFYRKNRKPQPTGDFGYAEKVTKELSPIDWSHTALQIHNQIRALWDWPCAATVINGKNVKIHKSVLSAKHGNKDGEIVDNNGVLTVCCGDGQAVDILEIQPDGKKKMDIKAFLAGNPVEIGSVIG